MKFSKYEGCGNDFILVDHRTPFFPPSNHSLIVKICHRKHGIGADGLIFLERSQKADFKMRIFNADGSEAEMCGNGIRCLFKFIQELGVPGNAFHIETVGSILHVSQDGVDVEVDMPIPYDFRWNISLDPYVLHYLNTGVPHAICFTDNLETTDVFANGRKIRHLPFFAPKGTNANFVSLISKNEIAIRTYERGVEDETLACGTGCTAAAIAAVKIKGAEAPVFVKTRSGETLKINFNPELTQVTMTGPATFIYSGSYKAT